MALGTCAYITITFIFELLLPFINLVYYYEHLYYP